MVERRASVPIFYPHADTGSYRNPTRHAYTYGDPIAYLDTHRHANSHGNPITHPNRYTNTNAHAHLHADAPTQPHHQRGLQQRLA